jgi:hypothetical protein
MKHLYLFVRPGQNIMPAKGFRILSMLLVGLFLVNMACNITAAVQNAQSPTQASPTLPVKTALKKATSPPATQTRKSTATKTKSPVATRTLSPTSLPTSTVQPTLTSSPTSRASDTPLPTPTVVDVTVKMKSARILLFEDVAGIYLKRYVQEALDNLGYPYVDVADRLGSFKEQLVSGVQWDLVISASEARSGVRGEFFDYIKSQLDNGGSAILEVWTLNNIVNGKIAPLMMECGVRYQSDWLNPPDSERSVWWLNPDNPVLNQPNKGISLAHPVLYWTGDAGDLISLSNGGDATLLGGTIPTKKTSFGTLAVCMQGRLILQTFSTHDYRENEIVPLWENYIYNTLKARFEGE